MACVIGLKCDSSEAGTLLVLIGSRNRSDWTPWSLSRNQGWNLGGKVKVFVAVSRPQTVLPVGSEGSGGK